MSIKDLLSPLGDPDELAETLGKMRPDQPISRDAIYQWHSRGQIPHRWHVPVLELAATRKVRLTATDLSARRRAS